MPCFFPLTGYRSKTVNPLTGKRPIVFDKAHGFSDLPINLPCNNCIGCRVDRVKEWTTRSIHESRMHNVSYFVTFTYDPEFLPSDGSLIKKDIQDLNKRLRHHFGSFRFFGCGEYGEKGDRPHYHVNYFGLDLTDLKPHSKNKTGDQLYQSDTLSKLWGKGFVTIGFFSAETAAYVAGYVIKKIGGKMADDHYSRLDLSTGEIFQVLPEFVLRSSRPAIGSTYLEKFGSDVFPSDFCIVKGKKVPTPKYYRKKLEVSNLPMFQVLKKRRVRDALSRSADATPDRLHSRRICLEAKQKLKSRTL